MSDISRPGRRPRYPMPPFIAEALDRDRLMEAYLARPPYQQNDYIGWITRAKRPETRAKRLAQMLDELAAGDAYMRMPYQARRDAEGSSDE
jgi:uncharacterized protein YdeI (YjbR/CyaY-like superfamily)